MRRGNLLRDNDFDLWRGVCRCTVCFDANPRNRGGRMAGKLVGSLMWMVAGTAASKMARSYTRGMLRRDDGAPRLPRKARRETGFGMMLGWAVLTGVFLAVTDVLSEQGKNAAKGEVR
jgi:hypothetical protein